MSFARSHSRPRPRRARHCAVAAVVVAGALACGEPTAPIDSNPMLVVQILRDGNRDVWRMRLDGSDTLRLTTHASDDTRPTISGNDVLFVSTRDGNRELYAVSAAGGAEQRLTTTTVQEGDPALSRSGSRVAFTVDSIGVARLFLAERDGTGRRPLTAGFGVPGAFDATPAWSAGDQLAFTSTSAGQAIIARVDANDGAPVALIADQPPNVEPSWSRDGRQVAFVSNRDNDAEVYLFTVSSGAVSRFTNRPGTDRRPQFLPDGRVLWIAQMAGAWKLVWADVARPAELHEVPLPAGVVEWVAVRQ